MTMKIGYRNNNSAILKLTSCFIGKPTRWRSLFSAEQGIMCFFKNMRYIGLIAIFVSFTAIAKPDCENYSGYSFPGPNGTRLGFSMKKSDILKTPSWDGVSEPPMKISEAVKLSQTALSEKKPYLNLTFESVAITQFGCNAPEYFYYRVSYHRWDEKDRLSGSYNVHIFFDGKVHLPKEIKDEILPE